MRPSGVARMHNYGVASLANIVNISGGMRLVLVHSGYSEIQRFARTEHSGHIEQLTLP